MADQTNTDAKAAAEAPAKVAATAADTAETVVKESAKAGKRAKATAARRNTRRAKTAGAARKTRATKAAASTKRRAKTNSSKAAASAPRNQGTDTMNSNSFFPGFDAFPAITPFQSLFATAGDRSQETVRRSQQVAEDLADLTRGNVEALTESARVASEGARSIGQDVIAKSRAGVEEAADAIRLLAEAKSPTEFIQLQSEIARASFDRLVNQSSRVTESVVKLAGEAIQPLSNRASANAERINTFVA